VHTVLAAGLATCALAISFCTNAQATTEATNGPQYLALNAIRPTGKTYVKICLWPVRPSNDRCD
jgi:hypothetical protein